MNLYEAKKSAENDYWKMAERAGMLTTNIGILLATLEKLSTNSSLDPEGKELVDMVLDHVNRSLRK